MGNWIVDEAHSTVGFEVTHMMVSKIRGQFDSYSVQINAEDITDLTNAEIEFRFDAHSINTRNRERDKHLKSADFFDAKNHPTIDFLSTHITKMENDHGFHVTGDLTIRGITKQITFDVLYGGQAIDPSGVKVYGYEAQTTINREEFGLKWNALLEAGGVLVGKEVKIKVDLELKEANAEITDRSSDINQPHNTLDPLEHAMIRKKVFQMIAENITDLVLIINQKGVIQYATPSFETVLNYNTSTLQQRQFYELVDPDEQDAVKKEVESFSNRMIKKELKSEFRYHHANGYYIEVEANFIRVEERELTNGDHEFILVVMRDISERKEFEKTVYQLAFHDALTNLPNRRSFTNQLRSEVMDRKFAKSNLSVFFIDLDDFKAINDRYGHNAGDVVLREIAQRIQSILRPTDLAARFGGDEFVVMLKDVQEREEVYTVAKKILTQIQKPIIHANQEYRVTGSVGVAHFPDHGESAEDLIKHADTALYYVKEHGKNHFMVFNQQMEHQSFERRILENALRQGIKEQQFFLEYQPKVNIKTNELIGMEALVRWEHPELGIIPPGKFIPLAEETGLIVPLGEWILRESCRQAKKWAEKGYPALNLSVNISVRQLEDINFIKKIQEVLEETRLEPERLELEITESVLVNIDSMISILKEIRGLGVRISVDDFGTGYSSLSYIKDLPIDTIKIDRSFVKDIHKNRESKEIAKAILTLANSIGLNTIAEGIELKEHVEELSEKGYILGQGFYYSRPLKKCAFEEYMESIYEVS